MPPRRFTDQQELQIAHSYVVLGKSTGEIGKDLNCPKPTILDILKRLNIPRRSNSESHRKYSLNEYVFDDLNDEATAYWYGFLYADGSLCRGRNSISLTLSGIDEAHIAAFLKFLGSNQPVGKRIQAYRDGSVEVANVCVRSHHMADRLRSLGVVPFRPYPERTLAAIPQDMFRHWLRGLFDGDGAAFLADGNLSCLRLHFMGARMILACMQDMLTKEAGVERHPKLNLHRGGKIWITVYSNRSACRKIYGHLYEGSSIWLPRKRTIIEQSLKHVTFSERYASKRIEAKGLARQQVPFPEIARKTGVRFQTIYRWRTKGVLSENQ